MSLVENAIKRLAESNGREKGQSGGDVGSAPPYGPSRGARSIGVSPTPNVDLRPPVPQKPPRQIDFAALRAAGMLAAEHERKSFSHVFRNIKRPILARAAQRGTGSPENARANVLLVTSAVPGDGKTFTAINLALSLALEKDKQVILIDGDVVRRELSRRLGFGGEGGLIDLLEDPSRSLDEFLLQTDVPSLMVLPAGNTSQHATELLSSGRMRSILEQCSSSRDSLVIFDSSPLLLTTESAAIAELAGQALLVVREGYTTKDMILRALPRLQACPSVSLLLNQSLSSPDGGYGYEYGEAAQV